jgi:hypothetical protein
MKKLIYFTLGNNKEYLKLADLCVKSLYHQNYDGDFLFITDLTNELFRSIKFKKSPLFLSIPTDDLLKSSANKLKLYSYENIKEYDKIIFSDLDILWTSNPDIIFNMLDEDLFFMSNEESLMSDEWWGARIFDNNEKEQISINNIKGVNAGIFAFNSNMINHLEKIDNFLNNNINLVNECLEQPFVNAYVYRNNLYNTKLNGLVSHKGYSLEPFDGVALHFAGGPGSFDIKYNKMINYYDKNF